MSDEQKGIVELNGKKYRVLAIHPACGSHIAVCDFCYGDRWHPVRDFGIRKLVAKAYYEQHPELRKERDSDA